MENLVKENCEKNYFENENLLIKGNELVVLHSLKVKYRNKVDVINIAPPYNPNVKIATWLVFMKNRLEVAKELLAEDGLIFITVKDKIVHYLKLLCDDIFGINNFIANIPTDVEWLNSEKLIGFQKESVLCFSKNKNLIKDSTIKEIETFCSNCYNSTM